MVPLLGVGERLQPEPRGAQRGYPFALRQLAEQPGPGPQAGDAEPLQAAGQESGQVERESPLTEPGQQPDAPQNLLAVTRQERLPEFVFQGTERRVEGGVEDGGVAGERDGLVAARQAGEAIRSDRIEFVAFEGEVGPRLQVAAREVPRQAGKRLGGEAAQQRQEQVRLLVREGDEVARAGGVEAAHAIGSADEVREQRQRERRVAAAQGVQHAQRLAAVAACQFDAGAVEEALLQVRLRAEAREDLGGGAVGPLPEKVEPGVRVRGLERLFDAGGLLRLASSEQSVCQRRPPADEVEQEADDLLIVEGSVDPAPVRLREQQAEQPLGAVRVPPRERQRQDDGIHELVVLERGLGTLEEVGFEGRLLAQQISEADGVSRAQEPGDRREEESEHGGDLGTGERNPTSILPG